MSDLSSNINTTDGLNLGVFKSPGVYVTENVYEYRSPDYIEKEMLHSIISDLRIEIYELRERLEKLENPEISKIRKEKIEKIFTEDE